MTMAYMNQSVTRERSFGYSMYLTLLYDNKWNDTINQWKIFFTELGSSAFILVFLLVQVTLFYLKHVIHRFFVSIVTEGNPIKFNLRIQTLQRNQRLRFQQGGDGGYFKTVASL